jgi:hypothetical protein
VVALLLIAESVVPVASKNTRKGDMPVSRTAATLRVRGPLVPVHDRAVGALTGGLAAAPTVTVADCVALPPVPVHVSV